MHKKSISISFVFLILLTIISNSVIAQTQKVPAKMQAALFKKIFLFDKTIKDQSDIKIYIVFDEKSKNEKSEISKAFAEEGIKSEAFTKAQFTANASECLVVYIAGNLIVSPDIFTENKILSLSGNQDLVKKGDVSIGLALENGKPKILINKNQLINEKHEVSSQLLKLAEVW